MTEPTAELDEQFMRQAIRLAMNGRGRVEPNPMVGCVIVKDGRVIGEGYHDQFRGPHAEPTALANCAESPEAATAYVTLEPCCHTNKHTPPCVPRLIEAKLARVVIGCLDANPEVNGKGVAMLRAAGIRVDGPVPEGAAKQLIAPFLARVQHRRAYVTAKWAQTADGRVAGPHGIPLRITNATASRTMHMLRAHTRAIVVGIGTVLKDDPRLTARVQGEEDHPAQVTSRFVLDSRLRLPLTSKLVQSLGPGRGVTVFCTSEGLDAATSDRIDRLMDAGVEINERDTDPAGRLELDSVFGSGSFLCAHVMVEPGPTLGRALLQGDHADRLWVYRSPIEVRDAAAPAAPEVPPHFLRTGEIDLAGDTLTEYLNPASPVFFAPEPSADFILAEQLKLK